MCQFAVFDYMESRQQIPVAFNILKKAPDFIWDWYIKKFNPLSVEKMDFDIASGLSIKLPLEKNKRDEKNIGLSVGKALSSYPQIEIVRPLKDYSFCHCENLKVSYGNYLFAFLAMQAIKKFIGVTKKDLSQLEIFIIDANRTISQILLDTIYPHVNYLSVLITEKNDFFSQKQHEIFVDTGLNIQLLNFNKALISNADVIINTGVENNFEYAIKRNAIYFDLGGNPNSLINLKIKRPDVFAIDNLNLSYGGKLIDTITLEMIFYCACKDFKKIISGKYATNLFSSVKNKIDTADIKISSFQKGFCN